MYLYFEDVVILVKSKPNAITATILKYEKNMHLKQFFLLL